MLSCAPFIPLGRFYERLSDARGARRHYSMASEMAGVRSLKGFAKPRARHLGGHDYSVMFPTEATRENTGASVDGSYRQFR